MTDRGSTALHAEDAIVFDALAIRVRLPQDTPDGDGVFVIWVGAVAGRVPLDVRARR